MPRSRPITAARVLLVATGAALVVIGLLVFTAAPSFAPQGEQARQAAAKPPEPQKPAAKPSEPPTPAASPASPAGDSGQRAFIDPATGQLREPTPDEVAALEAAAPRKPLTLASPPQFKQGPGGAVGMAVPEDLMSYSVAAINPDGTVSTVCVTGKAKAEGIVKSPATAKKTTKKEDQNHDR